MSRGAPPGHAISSKIHMKLGLLISCVLFSLVAANQPPPKLFGWLMEQQEQKDNADMRGAILVEASRLLQEYLQDKEKPQ